MLHKNQDNSTKLPAVTDSSMLSTNGGGAAVSLNYLLDEVVKLLTLLSLGPGPHLCNILCDKTGSIHKTQTLPKTTEVNGQKNWGTSEEYRQMGTGIRDRWGGG